MKTVCEIQNTLHESRHRIGFHYTALSEEVNITMRLRKSVRRRPWSWMGGALATGMIAGFFNRKPSSPAYASELTSSPKKSSFIKHAGTISSLFLEKQH